MKPSLWVSILGNSVQDPGFLAGALRNPLSSCLSEGHAFCQPDEPAGLRDGLNVCSALHPAGGDAGAGKLGCEEVCFVCSCNDYVFGCIDAVFGPYSGVE